MARASGFTIAGTNRIGFQKTAQWLLVPMVVVGLAALGACSREDGATDGEHGALRAAAGKGAVAARSAPQPGKCVAAGPALADGVPEVTAQVADCLRALARTDRPEAVRQAQALLRGGIKPNTGLRLAPLARALVAFPEEGQFKAYLAGLGVLAGKGTEVSMENPLTADDYLRLQGRLHDFDVETGTFPNGHNWLLAHLAALADSGLNKATFEETPPADAESDEQPYLLKGRVGGRTWQVQARNFGDWYDVGAVLTLLNRMAEEGAYPERFIVLDPNDQTAQIVAINAAALRELMAKGLLEMPSADLARTLGKEFEAVAVAGSAGGPRQ